MFELQQLEAIAEAEVGSRSKYGSLFTDLLTVNAKLWDIEEGKRDCERRKAFDDQFIALARAVYLENDRRAQISAHSTSCSARRSWRRRATLLTVGGRNGRGRHRPSSA